MRENHWLARLKARVWSIDRRRNTITDANDIILDHSDAGRRIVIDTKFNSVVTHWLVSGRNTARRMRLSDLRLPKVPEGKG